MPSHDFHHALEGYDPQQILHDGCQECERRSKDLELCLAFMDDRIFAKAWRRAFDWQASGGNPDAAKRLSHAELPLLKALWGVQLQLQKRGVPLTGEPPGELRPIYEGD